MKNLTRFLCVALFCLFFTLTVAKPIYSEEPLFSKDWQSNWNHPSAKMRPLQIVHGYFREDVSYYKDQCGLGGIVCNVHGTSYLRDESQWERLVNTVRKASDAGLRVWIYDEDGYPSLGAGRVVLDGHPELESLAMVYDASKEEPFFVRPAYEFTHASNNYAAARRYPNPLNPAATERFIEVTHEAYRKHLGEELFNQIEAFFTDEPSMIAVNIGEIPEKDRASVRVDDPINTSVQPLPMIPWFEDLPEKYQERYQEDLMAWRKSLFAGETDQDKKVRKQFWSLIADLNADRFYGAIERWCHSAGTSIPTLDRLNAPLKLASSGHTLHEEIPIAHVPLDGNKLRVLSRMDLPGMDELNSDPRIPVWGAWKAAAFPCSAAILGNKRLVMTEISDFSQIMGGEKPATLDRMQAASAWQAAWGVTEFTLYYGVTQRQEGETPEQTHKKYCDFIGRLNSVLREAIPVRSVMLYYPIADLQEEYLPTAQPLHLDRQSERAKKIVSSFDRLGNLLTQSQIPFILVDNLFLSKISDQSAHTLIVPEGVKLETTGGLEILRDSGDKPLELADLNREIVKKHEMAQIEPASTWMTLGTFEREGKNIYLLMNSDKETYQGLLHLPETKNGAECTVLDPSTGKVTKVLISGATEVNLTQNQTLLFVVPSVRASQEIVYK